MLIGVHIPKSGGTSIRSVLNDHFGKNLFTIYGEMPFKDSPEVRKQKLQNQNLVETGESFQGCNCIYGHFLPYRFLQYSEQSEIQFFTWFRHPVSRLISDYYHIRQNHKVVNRPFYKKILMEKWSLEQFLFAEDMQNFISQYLWSFPIEKFSFIGLVEYADTDFAFFCNQFLGKHYELPFLNVNLLNQNIRTVDQNIWIEAEKFHSKDMDLYAKAIEMRNKRMLL
jgi:hypothetical protein